MRSRQFRPDVATLDLASMGEQGPRCSWRGNDLMLLGRAIGGIHLDAKGARPWLMNLDALERAFARHDTGFDLGDRDVMLQLAVDAKAAGAEDAAEGLADCIRFPVVTPAEAQRIRPRLSFLAGHQPRVPYEIKSGWDESEHPRHPAGSPGSIGGRFAPKVMAEDPLDRDLRLSRFARALQHVDGISHRLQEMFYEVFEVEGYGRRDPSDTAKPVSAVAGIQKETLAAAKAAGIVPENTDLERLTYHQVATIYRWNAEHEIRRIGGAARYEEFKDPKTAAAIFDTLFSQGHGDGGRAIQKGINETLKRLSDDDLKRLGLPTEIEVDGVVGSRAFRILVALSNGGQASLIRSAIADARREWVKRNPKLRDVQDGWLARIERFR